MISSGRLRVVVDTNVFLSGIFFGGQPLRVLRLWQGRKIGLIVSPELEAEILGKLKAFDAPEELLRRWKDLIEENSIRILPKTVPPLSRDPRDNFLLAAAVAAEADFLVTGDKDLLTLGKIGRTRILKPAQFVTEFWKSERSDRAKTVPRKG